MIRTIIILVTGLILLGMTRINVWEQFLDNPNNRNYTKCEKEIDQSLSILRKHKYHFEFNTKTNSELIENIETYNRLLELINSKNTYAFKLGFHLRELSDGGAKEDLDVSLGNYINYNPEFFLSVFSNYINNYDIYSEYAGILVNLGDKYVDDYPRQAKELLRRLEKLKGIQNDKLTKAKTIAVDILKEELITLERIISEEEAIKQKKRY